MPPKQPSKSAASGYHNSVFINCPFDDGYKQLFEAAVFTVLYCGRDARSALEIYNSGQVRIEKIFKLIEACRFSIHDISAHGGDPATLIAKVRDWLNTVASTQPLPSGSAIAARFALFQSDIPAICATLHLVPTELTFVDYGHVVRIWLEQQTVSLPPV